MTEGGASIAVIGGTGLYRLLEGDVEERELDTPYGAPSGPISVGTLGGRRVAFLPRHGRLHTIPPHRINVRANLWALHSLGAERVIGACAVGSLRGRMAPGNVVVPDQLVNLSHGRRDTFFDGPQVVHVSVADPYCPELRALALRASGDAGAPAIDGGTLAVVDGPRFCTRAESRMYERLGFDLLNMTQYPEVVLARELGMCHVALAQVTDHDNGAEGVDEARAVTQDEVLAALAASGHRVRDLLARLVPLIPEERAACACAVVPVPVGRGQSR